MTQKTGRITKSRFISIILFSTLSLLRVTKKLNVSSKMGMVFFRNTEGYIHYALWVKLTFITLWRSVSVVTQAVVDHWRTERNYHSNWWYEGSKFWGFSYLSSDIEMRLVWHCIVSLGYFILVTPRQQILYILRN